jgi:transcriptional regulator with XRE-family HTH domain
MDALMEEVRARRRLPEPVMRRAIRKAAGVSQKRAGEEINVTHQAIARYEDGSRTPRGPVLVAYVGLLEALREESGL